MKNKNKPKKQIEKSKNPTEKPPKDNPWIAKYFDLGGKK